MTIRPADDKDRSVLSSLHISDDVESHKDAPDVMARFRLSELSSRAKDVILVAEDEGEVVGYFWAVALRLFDYRIGLLFYIYVDPRMRHKHIGRKLMDRGIEELHKIGVRRFWAMPEMRNMPTRHMLESLGFETGPEKVFYQMVKPGAKHEWEKE
jgi:L-amino acid N-acyltransferase YncA